MRTSLLFAFILVCAASPASAQSLSIFDLDASAFPFMKAKLYAFTVGGQQARPSASEITLTDDGQPSTVLSVTCPPPGPPVSISSVLVIDVSGSMSSGSGSISNMELAKAAASAWVGGLGLGGSECAVTSFDDHNYLNQDFTTNRTRLLSAIASLQPNGGTDYDAGLLRPLAGGLEVTKRAKHQKVIVFLTDGSPNQEPQTNAIIAEARRQGCLIYAVTLGISCPQSLKEISTQTGGTWFEKIVTTAEAEAVYQRILAQVQSASPCEITWQSGPACAAGEHEVMAGWSSQTARSSYSVAATAAAQLRFDPPLLYFRSKPVGTRFDTTVTVTAVNSLFNVTGITSGHTAYDITPKSFTLTAGESRTLTVSFTPPDSSYTWTRFTIQSDICEQTYNASASYPGVKLAQPTVKLDQPNGGEVFVAGSDTLITWSGIPESDTVKLEYSTNNGSTWQLIAEKAWGGSYRWHLPKTAGTQCLVRVNQLATADNGNGWAKRAGGYEFDAGMGVALDRAGKVYVTGSFSRTVDFGGTTLTSTNDVDAFLAKYRPDGSLEWAKNAGGYHGKGIALDSSGNIYVIGAEQFIVKYRPDGSIERMRYSGRDANSIAVDASGSIYVTGWFTERIDFDTITLTTSYADADIYVVKFRPDWSVEWAKQGGGPRVLYEGHDEGQSIAVDALGNIYVTGEFAYTADFEGTTLKSVGDQDVFLAKYRRDGSLDWVKRAGGKGYDAGLRVIVDASGSIYTTGYFSDTADFGGMMRTALGDQDVFVTKYRQDGSVEWVKRAGGTGSECCDPHGVAVDASGHIYVAGNYSGAPDIEGVALTGGGSRGLFVIQYRPDGSIEHTQLVAGSVGPYGNHITVDPSGSIYITGGFADTIDFGGNTLRANPGFNSGYDIFVWNIGDETLQSDISDAPFTIVAPLPAARDIDMGQVLVGEAKDSVVGSFVRNAGTYPFNVTEVQITGADASQFSLVSGIPPFDVPSSGSHPVEFHFRPASAGVKSAQLRIITQADTLLQTIRGEGIAPLLSVAGDVIDFGQLEIGSLKDTTISLAIRNVGPLSVDFSGASQLGPDTSQFSLLSGGGAFRLAPGESRSITLRFAPRFIGRTSGRLGFGFNGAGSPAVINLFGQGLGGLISIDDDSAYVGERRDIPLRLQNVKAASLQSTATRFRARIVYDRTILGPVGGSVVAGARYDTLTAEGSLGADDLLMRLPFIAMLGDRQQSPIDIVGFEWLDGQGQPVEFDVETESGSFRLLGICVEGGPRLFNPDGQVGILKVTPNPAGEIAEIEIETVEGGRTSLTVIDMLGRNVQTLFDGEVPSGRHLLRIATDRLTTGSYYLMLNTPTVRRVHRLDITK